jgi:succinyldiaminopimelate transaminase
VLIPEIAYPTYHVGALLAGADSVPVAIDAKGWPAADLAWLNSPSNPTGRVHSVDEVKACIDWSRKNKSVLISDECYLEFDHTAHSVSVLSQTGGDNTNILAVHSLSKRSSMAGYRAAFMVGDTSLIARIREIRKHGGMMVPLPVQKAMTAALADDVHVAEQRARYNARKDAMRPALEAAGFTIEFSDSGLYLWCTRNEDAWTSVAWLAERGILATPGSFYGQLGHNHIRIAMTASDAHISDAVQRLKA